jgi:hypothetical protein
MPEYSEDLCKCYTEMLSIKRGLASVDFDHKKVLAQYERDIRKKESFESATPISLLPYMEGKDEKETSVHETVDINDLPLEIRNKIFALTVFRKVLLTRYSEREKDLSSLVLSDINIKKLAAKYMADMGGSVDEVMGYCLNLQFEFETAYKILPLILEQFIQSKNWPIKGLCKI